MRQRTATVPVPITDAVDRGCVPRPTSRGPGSWTPMPSGSWRAEWGGHLGCAAQLTGGPGPLRGLEANGHYAVGLIKDFAGIVASRSLPTGR